MRLMEAIRSAVSAIAANALRSILTMLGIAIGVAAVIAMEAIGSGARDEVDRQVRSLGSNLLVVNSATARQAGVRLGAGTAPRLTDEDTEAIREEIEGIRAVSSFVNHRTQVVAGRANWNAYIQGVDRDWFVVQEWGIASGREFDTEELRRGDTVAVLGQIVAQRLFGEDDPIGQTVRIATTLYRVIGVAATKGGDRDDVVFLPLDPGRRRALGWYAIGDRSVMAIFVKFEREEAIASGINEMTALLRQRHRLRDDQEDDFTIRNLTEVTKAAGAAMETLALLVAGIASISLLVGGVGIMNIMLVSVTQRTREIGLRLAVGARPRDIRTQFVIEAAMLSTLGGIVGVGLGITAAHVLATLGGWALLMSLDAVLLAVGLSALVGIFFGLYPAQRASRLNPIDALRQG
jgi:putative ABC transport system permease protein